MLLNPIVWRIPGRAAKKLYSFAHAEQASKKDLYVAARLTPSPERAALYFDHAQDEVRHEKYFTAYANDLRRARGQRAFERVDADIEHLFESLGEVAFLAFVNRGEERACAQFITYRNYFERIGDEKTMTLFDRVLQDEVQHGRYTRSLLLQLAGSEEEARKAMRKVTRWEAWRAWRRMGNSLANKAYAILMAALYVLALPFALLVRVVAPSRPGWQLTGRSESKE
jgi:rubrerythrin